MRATGATVRRERARDEMRGSILDAARHMVVELGVNNLSMRAIARELGYSPAALYEYFPGKEDLCRALYFEGAKGLNTGMQGALDALPEGVEASEAIKALGRAYRAFALASPELYRLVFDGTMVGYHPSAAERACSKEAFEILIETARRGVERGVVVPLPPEVLAIAAWSTVHGFVMLELNGMLAPKGDDDCAPALDDLASADLFEATLDLLSHGFVRRDLPQVENAQGAPGSTD